MVDIMDTKHDNRSSLTANALLDYEKWLFKTLIEGAAVNLQSNPFDCSWWKCWNQVKRWLSERDSWIYGPQFAWCINNVDRLPISELTQRVNWVNHLKKKYGDEVTQLLWFTDLIEFENNKAYMNMRKREREIEEMNNNNIE